MINRYVISAALIIAFVFAGYFIKFYVALGYGLSNDPAVWAQLGDYAGGMLNPLLSFVSIVLLIKSLTLQNEANISLRNELKNSEKTENLRSFEALFFNMIDSQKRLFESFKVQIQAAEGKSSTFSNVDAVMAIESEIENIRNAEGNDEAVREYLESIDSQDKIFGLARAFYIMVMVVTDKLSDSNGFSVEDRKAHFQTLVNFTDFSQLRLILICVQFMDYQSSKYIGSSIEFKAIIENLGMGYELY
tara:strand:+ start:6201 stop:6941 length:741 start_codon:yes stop_codon:yes gene_type:complete